MARVDHPARRERNVAETDEQQLHAALLSAFPTQASLARMVRFRLNENLQAIAGNGPLNDVVLELLSWASSNGRTNDLIAGARAENPGNPKLAAVANARSSVVMDSTPATPIAPASTATRRCVVLTALRLEFRAVHEQLEDVREVIHPTAGTVYDVGRLAGGWEVALAEVGAGNINATLETERAIDHFNPQAVVFVGVAGGLKDVKLGDVVVATKVYGYESGKDTPDGFRPRPELGMAGHALLQRAKAEARGDGWRTRIKGTPAPDGVEVYTGAIAAGEKVLANASSELVRFLRANYGDTLAVEMEGHGVMQAAHQRGVNALVVRGISDLVDGKAEADKQGWQPRAARHAAAFAAQVLAKL